MHNATNDNLPEAIPLELVTYLKNQQNYINELRNAIEIAVTNSIQSNQFKIDHVLDD
jgi:hypothetical protein